MKVLCDRNVEERYVETFRRADRFSVARVSDVLSTDAPDSDIGAYAETHRWVVFTADKRFLVADDERSQNHDERERIDANCGVVYYRKRERPSPNDVVAALEAVAAVYTDHADIETYVPGEWV